MADKKDTALDKALDRGKNSKYLVPVLVGVLLVGGTASFLDDVCTIRKYVGLPCEESGGGLSLDEKAFLENRAEKITAWLDSIVSDIEATNRRYQEEYNCSRAVIDQLENPTSDTQQRVTQCDEVGKKTFELSMSFREISEEFTALHKKHLEQLAEENDLAVHETARDIFLLIEQTKKSISTGIVGFDNEEDKNVGYLHGYPDVVLSLRYERPELVFDPYVLCAEDPNEIKCKE